MSDVSVSQTLVIGHIWQSVALAGVLALVLILGKRMRGSTRYSLGVAAFVASLLLPLAAFIPGETIVSGLLKQLNAPVALPAADPPRIAAAAAPTAPDASLLVPVNYEDGAAPSSMFDAPVITLAQSEPVLTSAATQAPMFTLPEIKLPDLGLPLLAIWLGVALFLLARTVRDLIAVERLVARAVPAELPAALKSRMKGVRVLVSPEAPGPMAAGLFRPCIVMPESIALGSPGMAALLEHEHAHIRRRDMLAALGQRIVLALLWWSPALYWMSRRIDEEREVACDEAAVDRTGDAKAFARSLTKQAENQLWVRAPRLAVGAIGPRSHFSRRVRRLIDMAKTGGSPAKYSGRLAFACLVLAVGVAAMVTPRFTAEAQPPAGSPEGAIDLTSPEAADKAAADNAREADQDAKAQALVGEEGFTFAFNGHDFEALGAEIEALMAELGPELEGMLAELGPELDGEFAGLGAEMAALGVDIAAMVSQGVIADMPNIMDEVRRSLEQAGIDVDSLDDWQDLKDLKGPDMEEARRALEDAREEMRRALGPEMQAEIRAAMAEAREEIASHRGEIAAALGESKIGLAAAKEALAAARAEIDAARARGDFKAFKPGDFERNFNFDIEREVRDAIRNGAVFARDFEIPQPLRTNAKAQPGYAIYLAADDCDIDALSKLVAGSSVDVNRVFRGDGTPLIAAVRSGCEEGVRLLLNAGADPNLASRGDGNPLMTAVEENNATLARLLLHRGAKPNAPAEGDGNALIVAAREGNVAMARLLIERGADVNGYVKGDETPLITAAEQGELEVVRLLVERGANVNLAYKVEGRGRAAELRSPLNMAERHGHDDVVKFLRDRGAVSAPNSAN